jgi:hypothetical protein
MISYWKNWGFHFAVGILNILVAIHHLATNEDLLCVAWLLSGLYWIGSSVILNNRDNIKKLHERVSELENRSITEIEQTAPNHYTCFRRLGPDKNVPFSEEQPSIEERIKVSDKDLTYFKVANNTLGFVPGKGEPVSLTGEQLKEFALGIMEESKDE